MTEPLMLQPGEGRKIEGKGMNVTVKVPYSQPALTASFEVVIPPGYDVGAHVHDDGEEVFFVIEGELDLLAFEPLDRTVQDWKAWESRSGQQFMHGGPGAFMFVPEGVPHAFANTTDRPVRMFFQSSVSGGHENYFDELAAILRRSDGKPDPKDIADLRKRYDIEQLTALRGGGEAKGPEHKPLGAEHHDEPHDHGDGHVHHHHDEPHDHGDGHVHHHHDDHAHGHHHHHEH